MRKHYKGKYKENSNSNEAYQPPNTYPQDHESSLMPLWHHIPKPAQSRHPLRSITKIRNPLHKVYPQEMKKSNKPMLIMGEPRASSVLPCLVGQSVL
jgi:hypothetical protein